MAFENDPDGYRMAAAYAGSNFDKPREVTIETFCAYASEEWTLDGFLEAIKSAIDEVPPEKRAVAKVELEGGYEESSKLVIWYRGLESADEVAERVRRCEEYVFKSRASERATFERLKKKFG